MWLAAGVVIAAVERPVRWSAAWTVVPGAPRHAGSSTGRESREQQLRQEVLDVNVTAARALRRDRDAAPGARTRGRWREGAGPFGTKDLEFAERTGAAQGRAVPLVDCWLTCAVGVPDETARITPRVSARANGISSGAATRAVRRRRARRFSVLVRWPNPPSISATLAPSRFTRSAAASLTPLFNSYRVDSKNYPVRHARLTAFP